MFTGDLCNGESYPLFTQEEEVWVRVLELLSWSLRPSLNECLWWEFLGCLWGCSLGNVLLASSLPKLFWWLSSSPFWLWWKASNRSCRHQIFVRGWFSWLKSATANFSQHDGPQAKKRYRNLLVDKQVYLLLNTGIVNACVLYSFLAVVTGHLLSKEDHNVERNQSLSTFSRTSWQTHKVQTTLFEPKPFPVSQPPTQIHSKRTKRTIEYRMLQTFSLPGSNITHEPKPTPNLSCRETERQPRLLVMGSSLSFNTTSTLKASNLNSNEQMVYYQTR